MKYVQSPTGAIATVLIALGSNLGKREQALAEAKAWIGKLCGTIMREASLYESHPMGLADQTFINTAIIIQTTLTPMQLLQTLKHIEHDRMGRDQTARWSNRIIDCDIILWRDPKGQSLTMHSETLNIPHPHCLDRDFVLEPACDIAGDWWHPERQCTLANARTQWTGTPTVIAKLG